MRRLVNVICWLGIFLSGAGMAAVITATRVHGQEVKQGRGLVCDTKEQVERYVALYKKGDDVQAIVESVNLEVGKESACGIIPVAFVEIEAVGTVRGEGGAARIVKILVVAISLGPMWQRVPPFEQYTAMPIEERGA